MNYLLEKSYRVLMYDEPEDYNSAIAYLTDVTDQQRANTHVFNNLGVAHFEIGELDSAAINFAAAIRESETNAVVYANLARLDDKTGQVTSAIENYGKAIIHDSANPTYWRCRAFLNVKTNALHHAIRDFTAAIELAPSFKRT